jgi:hypothetical protein
VQVQTVSRDALAVELTRCIEKALAGSSRIVLGSEDPHWRFAVALSRSQLTRGQRLLHLIVLRSPGSSPEPSSGPVPTVEGLRLQNVIIRPLDPASIGQACRELVDTLVSDYLGSVGGARRVVKGGATGADAQSSTVDK